jgi:hypothetical protein
LQLLISLATFVVTCVFLALYLKKRKGVGTLTTESEPQHDPTEWLEYAQSKLKESPVAFLVAIDHASIRCPDNLQIFSELQKNLDAIMGKTTGAQRQHCLKMVEVIVTRFSRACSLKDLTHAEQAQKVLMNLYNEEVKAQSARLFASLRDSVERYSSFVEKVQTSGHGISDIDLKAIESIDGEIDQTLLAKADDLLRQKYQSATRHVMTFLEKRKESNSSKTDESVIAYNRKAIAAIKMAFDLGESFGDNEIKSNDNKLTLIADHLGGWKDQMLLPPVSVYKGNVYNDLFRKFEHQAKVGFTEKVLERPERNVA